MPLNVAFQMDHISTVNIAGDSTFAIMLEAQARGHRMVHYTVDTLAMLDGKVTAKVQPVTVRDLEGDHFTLGEPERLDLSSFDVIHMRQDPPFDMAYISATHMLERIHPATLVVNDPAEVRNAPEKLFVVDFADFMPPTLITRDRDEIAAFRAKHGEVVLKPLYGNGGKAVFRIAGEDQNYGSLVDMFEENFPEPWVIQKYLMQVRAGDKRILFVDGDYAGAVNRIPAADDLRSNMVQGGRAEATNLTPREREICDRLGPELKKRGMIFVGIDVIGDYLTEINVTSPTGIRAVKNFGGPDVAALIWDAIETRRS